MPKDIQDEFKHFQLALFTNKTGGKRNKMVGNKGKPPLRC